MSEGCVPARRKTRVCATCGTGSAAVRGSDGEIRCRECFVRWLENSVLACIRDGALLAPGERVAVAISGGKDSTALAHVLSTLNRREDMHWDLQLLCIDEGIHGYRDKSIATVHRNAAFYGLPLLVLPFEQLFGGYTLDTVAARTATRDGAAKNTCTYCGVFRRQALDIGAETLRCTKLATGHNADDAAETVLLNLMRGDVARLDRCRGAGGTGARGADFAVPRVRPFQYVTQRDIVFYAHFCKLDFFAVECPYACVAFRSYPRHLIKELEAVRPTAVLDIVRSGETFLVAAGASDPTAAAAASPEEAAVRQCERCHRMTSQTLCQACALLDKLGPAPPPSSTTTK